MVEPLAWIDAETRRRCECGLERRLRNHTPATAAGARITFDGRSLVNFASNDYLSLANDASVREAAVSAIGKYGFGAGSSPLVSGWSAEHTALCEELAAFESAERAMLFPSGYAANIGTITALAESGDVIYSDELNHASLIDGSRLSRAEVRVYPHADAAALESLLREDRGRFRRSLIATESVFSMDGDLAPLSRLVELAEAFSAMLLVDEAHATGVIGPGGRGGCAAEGVADRVHVRVGTLSKALGSLGGFVVGEGRLIDWLINRARSLIFSTSLPIAAVAAARRALARAQAEPDRRERLIRNARELIEQLGTGAQRRFSSVSPIIPVIVGEPKRALRVGELLETAGYRVGVIRPPSVPTGTSRLRLSVQADHTNEEIAGLASAVRQALSAG